MSHTLNEKLAVFTLQLGALPETFIRLHVESLLPGRTVAVARYSSHPMGGYWEASCPVLFLDRWAIRLPVRLARRAGMSEGQLYASRIGRFLREHKVRMVIGEYLDQFIDFVPLLERMGIPYIVQGHGNDVSASLRAPGMAERFGVLGSARAILTRCEFHRQRLIQIGLPADKVHVNPGGVYVPTVPPKRKPEAAKRLLAIGRMVPKKGPIYLLEAFRQAANMDPDITLDYMGDGELLPAARQFVDALGLGSRVRIHGAGAEEIKQRLLEECGVFVQHSITDPDTGNEEGLPASIQEAMAHGMPVISTRHAGIPEAIEEGTMGWLVEECDSAGMAQAMARMASQNGTWTEFGAAAHAKAARIYSWSAERSRLLKHLCVHE
jgi:colanic acid/amylovoran biosynthesis glycosyltransferase